MYPAARYCRDGRMVIVKDEAEAAALGPDWSTTPATWEPVATVISATVPVAPPPVKRKPGRPRKVKADGDTSSL